MSSSWYIIGLGSPHGDDQVGWKAVELLRGRCRGGDAVWAAKTPLDVVDRLDPSCHAVVIDACQTGTPPGTICRWTWPTDPISGTRSFSSHGLAIGEVLQLAATLGRAPRSVVVFGVEIESCQPGEGLSGAVARSLPRLVELIEHEEADSLVNSKSAGEEHARCREQDSKNSRPLAKPQAASN